MKQLLEYKILESKNQIEHKIISEEENNLMDLDGDNIVINDNDISHDDSDSIVSANSGIDVLTNTFHHTNSIAHEIDLLKLIIDMGAPLYAYEHIMKWAKESYMSKYTFDSKHKTYQQTINYLEKQLQFNICCPIKILVELSQDQFSIDVVVFDVKKCLHCYLMTLQLTKKKIW